jgi:hypothetical protein
LEAMIRDSYPEVLKLKDIFNIWFIETT